MVRGVCLCACVCVGSLDSSVRVSVYKTIELWLQVAGASAGVLQGSPAHSELLFANLLGDITPGADAVRVRSRRQCVSLRIGLNVQ